MPQILQNSPVTNTIPTLRSLSFALLAVATVVSLASSTVSAQIEGFTEPFRSVDLSSDEAGAIAALEVREGDSVAKGNVVARLDDRVQKIQLEIASRLASASSELEGAQRTYQKRQTIYDRLVGMQQRGHASQSEIIRAELELSIAQARYDAVREEGAVRKIEMQRAEVQLDRRYVRAPFDGVISKIHRREGEFLSPVRPEVVTIVQVDRLLTTFAVPVSQATQFQVGREFELKFENGLSVTAVVHSMSVNTDAESQTVEVKLVFDNPDQEIRAGEICTLNI